ncbi:MAG: hypothetical protein H0W34_07325 [Pyrinomonadaceae bacterium]|nr:hypothetical protein [Pyrinomonadaceae bacterium]
MSEELEQLAEVIRRKIHRSGIGAGFLEEAAVEVRNTGAGGLEDIPCTIRII